MTDEHDFNCDIHCHVSDTSCGPDSGQCLQPSICVRPCLLFDGLNEINNSNLVVFLVLHGSSLSWGESDTHKRQFVPFRRGNLALNGFHQASAGAAAFEVPSRSGPYNGPVKRCEDIQPRE